MTITEAIRKHGLEFLRGRVVANGSQRLIINDKDLDAAIELWEDEPENAYRQLLRLRGQERPDALRLDLRLLPG